MPFIIDRGFAEVQLLKKKKRWNVSSLRKLPITLEPWWKFCWHIANTLILKSSSPRDGQILFCRRSRLCRGPNPNQMKLDPSFEPYGVFGWNFAYSLILTRIPFRISSTCQFHHWYICSAQSKNRYNSRIVLRKVWILTLLRNVGILTLRSKILELLLRKVRIWTKWESHLISFIYCTKLESEWSWNTLNGIVWSLFQVIFCIKHMVIANSPIKYVFDWIMAPSRF